MERGEKGLMNAHFDPGAGFADPVFASQTAFRAILSALSEPGTIHALDAGIEAPEGLQPASAVILLTLADYETPVWLDEAARESAAGAWLRFHAAAPLVTAPAEAGFAVISGAESTPKLADFSVGDDLFPDRSTTILVECAALDGGEPVTLSGPGIPDARTIAPKGLRPGFWTEVAANNAIYPLGIDMLLVAGDRIMGLPRSTIATSGGRG